MERIASFDIGKKNFAFCIEELDCSILQELKALPKSKQFKVDGTPTRQMQEILDQVCGTGKIILHENLDLTAGCEKGKKLDPQTFYNMTTALDQFDEYWDECMAFVIEEQMGFGRKINLTALKLGQHCFSYFLFRYGSTRVVTEFPAYHKTRILGAPKVKGRTGRWKAVSKAHRKKWAIEKAKEILTTRGEEDVWFEVRKTAKKDDLADVVVQLQAFKYLVYVEKSL